MIKKFILPFKITFFIFFLILIILKSCSPIEEKIDYSKIFRYNESKNITSLDPAFARNPQNIWPIQQMFNSLVQLDDSLNIKPEIAKRWEIDKSGLRYIFTLRNDVYFHSSDLFGKNRTRKVIANDFKYSFDRLKNKNIGSPGIWVLNNVKKYEALNDSVFEIILKKPFPAFLSLLSMRYCSVVPHEITDFYKQDFRNHPIGTGPFKFKKWKENVKLVLRKNENYFEKDIKNNKLPYLEAISITFLPDVQTEFMLFKQGELDFMKSIDNSFKDDLLTPNGNLVNKYAENIKMLKGPILNTEYIGFNLESKSEVVKSEKIRKAINIGFDRNQLISYLRNHIGFPADRGFIPKGLSGHLIEDSITYNPIKAKKLVDEFIKTTNLNPTITLSTDPNYIDICEFIQRELQKIGIKVIINMMPTASLKQAKNNGKVDAFRASWIADYPDAENYLSLFYSKNFSPLGPNYTHYKNFTYDSLYEKSFGITELKNRISYYTKMNELIMETLPVIPIYYDQGTRFFRKNIKNIGLSPINLIHLKNVYKEN